MAMIAKGEFQIEQGLGLPNLTTVDRTAYTPPSEGYKVWDTDLNAEYTWDGAAWKIVGLTNIEDWTASTPYKQGQVVRTPTAIPTTFTTLHSVQVTDNTGNMIMLAIDLNGKTIESNVLLTNLNINCVGQ